MRFLSSALVLPFQVLVPETGGGRSECSRWPRFDSGYGEDGSRRRRFASPYTSSGTFARCFRAEAPRRPASFQLFPAGKSLGAKVHFSGSFESGVVVNSRLRMRKFSVRVLATCQELTRLLLTSPSLAPSRRQFVKVKVAVLTYFAGLFRGLPARAFILSLPASLFFVFT